MGNTNKNFLKAKREKNNEFYTLLIDIEKELKHYTNHFKGKTVYCNCDDISSNFWKYFHMNFSTLGIKKLINTHYEEGKRESFAMIYEGGDDYNIKCCEYVPINSDDFYDAGDFRSKDCLDFLVQADILVTNPPFSLWRKYISLLIKYNKKFLIIGNLSAMSYKKTFQLIKENIIWIGYNVGQMSFYIDKKKRETKMISCNWYTNIRINKENEKLKLYKIYHGNEYLYPKYDNYNAINVDKVSEIPIDYEGIMGVPVTFLKKYNSSQFEIIGIGRGTIGAKLGIVKNHRGRTDLSYILPDGTYKEPYSRILIKNKHPLKKAE